MTEKQKIRNQYKVSHNNSYTKLLNECKKYKENPKNIIGIIGYYSYKASAECGIEYMKSDKPTIFNKIIKFIKEIKLWLKNKIK